MTIKRISSAQLTETITYISDTVVIDAIGGETKTAVDGATVCARIQSSVKQRVVEGGGVASFVSYMVDVRGAPITDSLKQRIRWNETGKTLLVQGLERGERDISHTLICIEATADN